MQIKRRKTKQIKLGKLKIGGDAPIVVQSMTKVHPEDVEGTLLQIEEAYKAGCEVIRIAVPDKKAVEALKEIKIRSPIPIIADLHFSHKLAMMVLDTAVEGIRVNPGTLSKGALKEVLSAAKEKGVTVRIGVNSGSLPEEYHRFEKLSEALVACALDALELGESVGLYKMKFSLKASDVGETLEANRRFAALTDYPLHLGLTEAGPLFSGAIKSAVALSVLLSEGIGDTIRVSLTGPPVLEVKVAYKILSALGLRRRGVDIVSCPTCGRCKIDIVPIVTELEKRLEQIAEPLTVAVMGCAVNGPTEASHADVGIAAGRKVGVLFRKGRIIDKLPPGMWIDRVLEEVNVLLQKASDRCNESSEAQ